MKRLTKQLLALAAAAAFALPASAVTFGDGGAALQTVFDDITVGGPSSVDVANDYLHDSVDSAWALNGGTGSISTIIIELAGYKGTNTFGIYDDSTMTTVELFGGANAAGDTVTLQMTGLGEVYINGSTTGTFFSGNNFGFYLDASIGNNNPDAVFYSDTGLNTDGVDHMAAYAGTGVDDIIVEPWINGSFAVGQFIMAWEDLFNGGDRDFTDFVVIVESVDPVPEPAILSLLALGLIGVGAASRRRQV